jgi:hypothetical protein
MKKIFGLIIMLAMLISLPTINISLALPNPPEPPKITDFFNLETFNIAANSPPVLIDFDTIDPGEDITGDTVNGVTFSSGESPSALLYVIEAENTYTPTSGWLDNDLVRDDNQLFATSGGNVLSPGGTELAPGEIPSLE